jgi:hypothetical protein
MPGCSPIKKPQVPAAKNFSAWGLVPYWDNWPADPIHPPRAIYLDIYWRELEPTADSPLTKEAVLAAIQEKVKLVNSDAPIALRFKATGDEEKGPLPNWFKPSWRAPQKCNREHQQLPAWIEPDQLKAHAEIVEALAKALDGNPRIAWIEPGSYGYWGEGHVDNAPASCVPSIEIREALIRPWIESFHLTSLSVNMDWFRPKDDPTNRLRNLWGKAASIGLRFDCLGFWHDEYASVIEDMAAAKLPGWNGPWGGEFCYSEKGAGWATGSDQFAKEMRKHAPAEVATMNGKARFDRTMQVVSQCQWSYIAGAGSSLITNPTGNIALSLEQAMTGPPRDLARCAKAARIGNP